MLRMKLLRHGAPAAATPYTSSLRHFSGAQQTKGQLGGAGNALHLRHRYHTSVTALGSGIQDFVNGGSDDGSLANRNRIMSSVTDFGTRYQSVTREIGVGRVYCGLTSLQHNVKLMYDPLVKSTTVEGMDNSNYYKTGSGGMKFILQSEKVRKDPAKAFDDFLPRLLRERTPNAGLNVFELQKLRTQQRLLRSEFHARVQVLSEHSFARGHTLSASNGKRGTAYSADSNDSKTTYSAGTNLPAIAAFFDLFRLTRLAFTLEGEIVFTPEGSMDWRSLADVAAKELEASKVVFNKMEGINHYSSKTFLQPSGDGVDGLISSSVLPEKVLRGETSPNSTTIVGSIPEGSTTTVNGGISASSGTPCVASIAESSTKLAGFNAAFTKKPTVVSPKTALRSTMAEQIPELQRTNLTADMQRLMVIALNAIEVELMAIEKEIDALDENAHSASPSSSSAEVPLTPSQKARRIARIVGTAQENMLSISDAIFMCGRGTEVVDSLLDTVEEAMDSESSVQGSDLVCDGKKKKISHPLLCQQLVRIRQQFYAPSKEEAAL